MRWGQNSPNRNPPREGGAIARRQVGPGVTRGATGGSCAPASPPGARVDLPDGHLIGGPALRASLGPELPGHVSAGVAAGPRGSTDMNAFDVWIHAIRRRPDRRPFEVRWHAAGRARAQSFITRGLADSYRAELIRAARTGLDFSPGTGEPGVLGDTRACHHQLAGPRGGLRCDEMAPGRWLHPGRHRRRAGDHHTSPHHARPAQAPTSGTAYGSLRARLQPCPGQH